MNEHLFFRSGLRKHDVCFLITVRPTQPYGTKFDRRQPFVEQTGLVYVRGCEIQGMLDDKGRVIEEGMAIFTSLVEAWKYNLHRVVVLFLMFGFHTCDSG